MLLLEQLLEDLPLNQRQLCFIFEYSDKGFVAEAILALPTGNILARNELPVADHKTAVDDVVEKLAKKIRENWSFVTDAEGAQQSGLDGC